jgi:hypothetical protein
MAEAYAAFIDAQLAAEITRRESVNTRAATLLTSAGALVALALAVLAVLRGKDFVLTGAAKLCLVIAVGALFASAACAVGAGIPWTMKMAGMGTLRGMVNLKGHWNDPNDTARRNTAYVNVRVIESLRKGTKTKYRLFYAAGLAQIVAVGALVACVLFVAYLPPRVVHPRTCWWPIYCGWGDPLPTHHPVAVPTSVPIPTVYGQG